MKQLNSLGFWKSTVSFWNRFIGANSQLFWDYCPDLCHTQHMHNYWQKEALGVGTLQGDGTGASYRLRQQSTRLDFLFNLLLKNMVARSSHIVCRKFVDSHERSDATKVWVHNIKNQKHLSPKTIANCLRTDIVIEYKHYTLCNAGCRGLAHAWTTGIHLLSAQHQIQGCTVTSQDSSRWLNIITRNVHSVLREEKWAVLCVLLPAWEMWMSSRVVFSAMFTHGGQAQTKA